MGVQCCWNKLKARTDKSKRLRPETEGAQQHALGEAAAAAAAAAAMENTLDAKDREQRSSTDFDAESRDAEGGKMKNNMSIPSACPILNTYTSQQCFLV